MGPTAAMQTPAPSNPAAALMLGHPAFYARLHRFVFLPSVDMHASWHDACFPPAVVKLLAAGKFGQGSAHRWLSQHLLATLQSAGAPALAVTSCHVFALLERERLWRFVQHASAVLAARAARAAVDGGQVASWRAAMGAELHSYALERSPLLVPQELAEALARASGPDTPQGQLVHATATVVASLRRLTEASPGVWERLKLKLPRPLAGTANERSVVDLPPAADRLLHRILREIEPQWYSSFTSQAA
jgi:hypothetical protein